LITILVIFIYYSNSGMKKNFPPSKLIEKIDTIIFNKYTGFSLLEIDDYIFIKLKSFKYLFTNNNLENVQISINQQNLYKLELERKSKLNDKFFKFTIFADARVKKEEEIFRIKMRLKGDRNIHWDNKDQSSYKIDLKGEKRLWGLEEFSVQKPITRNYIYEFIFHKLLEYNNLISLKYFFINLSVNDTKQGIYAVEEGFSKELIERNKKRNGPIFGLNEDDGVQYPNVFYDLYSKNYWLDNYPDLTKKAFAKLNQIKSNEAELSEFFDLEKWAKFFAVVDYSNALHGSLSKSVKLFYNPASGKFEPIGFDGHYYELNPANNFLILDFLNPNNTNCNHICYDRAWYNKFLKDNDGNINNKFIDLYLKELKNISSNNFLSNFEKKYKKDINFYNSQFFSEKSNKDRGLYKGLGYFIYDNEYLKKRKEYIQKRLKLLGDEKNLKISLDNNKIKLFSKNKNEIKEIRVNCNDGKILKDYIYPDGFIKFNKKCDYLIDDRRLNIAEKVDLNSNFQKINFYDLTNGKDLSLIGNKYYLESDLIINKNILFPENKELIINKGVKIFFKKEAIFSSKGSITFNGTENEPIIINGNKVGSIILSDNKYNIKFTELNELSYPKIEDKILYGGINIINSDLKILNLEIKNSLSEDAINIISSISSIDNLIVSNSFSDAIDIDFGKINFEKIHCKNINNDCFDISGSEVFGNYLEANNVRDKGISFGEESIGEINLVNLKKNYLGIAVKDGSDLIVNEGKMIDNTFDVSVFKKKNEFEEARLVLKKSNKSEKLKALIGKDNNFTYQELFKINKVNNEFIYNLFY